MTFLPSAVKKTIIMGVGGEPRPAMPVASYPGTAKIVLDSTGAKDLNTVWTNYNRTGSVPHFTLDVAGKTMYQHIATTGSAPIDESSKQAPHKRGKVIWVCVAKASTDELSGDEWFWVGQALQEIADFVKVRTNVFTDFPGPVTSRDKGVQLTLTAWYQFSGVAAAGVIPFVNRFGPGKINLEMVRAGLENVKPSEPEPEPEPEGFQWPPFRGRSLSPGSKGKMIEKLQRHLGVKVTGEYGEDLEVLVLAIKEEIGLEENGDLDSDVWEAFGKYFAQEEEDE